MTQLDRLGNVPVNVLPCKNTSGSDIAAKLAVILDTSNPPDGSGTPMGIKLPASDANAFGITLEAIPNNKIGRVAVIGSVAVGSASGTVHVGDYVMTDSAGKILAQTAGKYQIGMSLSEAVSTDDIKVLIMPAKNA